MKLRRGKKKKPGLMLTSLLDMFTIILIFLIVSFEAEDYEFKLDPGLTLPESGAKSVFKPAVNVAITKAGVSVQQEVVYPLQDGRATPEDLAAEEMPQLVEALKKVLQVREAYAEEGEEEEQGIMILQADKGLEYKTLYLVMRSARLAGFDKYRLAVMKK